MQGWSSAQHPPRTGLGISQPFLNPRWPCISLHSVMNTLTAMKSTGRNFKASCPPTTELWKLELEFWGHRVSRAGFLYQIDIASTSASHMCHCCFMIVLNCGDYYPCCTGKQQHAIQPGNRGTRPRHVSSKPTLGLNLEMGSGDRHLELVMLGCNDMFTCLSSVGREGELGFLIFSL